MPPKWQMGHCNHQWRQPIIGSLTQHSIPLCISGVTPESSQRHPSVPLSAFPFLAWVPAGRYRNSLAWETMGWGTKGIMLGIPGTRLQTGAGSGKAQTWPGAAGGRSEQRGGGGDKANPTRFAWRIVLLRAGCERGREGEGKEGESEAVRSIEG